MKKILALPLWLIPLFLIIFTGYCGCCSIKDSNNSEQDKQDVQDSITVQERDSIKQLQIKRIINEKLRLDTINK